MAFFSRKKKDEPKKVADEAPKVPEKKEKAAPTVTGDAHRVLYRPLVTEKSTAAAKNSAYVFEVAPDANKLQIRQAVKAVYGVEAVKIRVLMTVGKPVRTRAGWSRRRDWRKAIVTLKKGQTLDVFANA